MKSTTERFLDGALPALGIFIICGTGFGVLFLAIAFAFFIGFLTHAIFGWLTFATLFVLAAGSINVLKDLDWSWYERAFRF